MKKIAIIILTGLALSSCSDEFITKDPLAVGSNVTYYDTPANCELAVNAIYDPLQWEEMYSRNFWAIADVASDDAEKGGGKDALQYNNDQIDMGDINTYSVTQLNSYLINMWKGYYIGIGRANALLDQTTDQLTLKDSAVYRQYRGEARFLRAYFYFDLARIWGPVPLVTTTVAPSDAKNIGNRAAGDDAIGTEQMRLIYNFVIDELTAIQNDLPWSHDADNYGRVTRGTVQAMLAKALLYRADIFDQDADYETSYQVSKTLIESSALTGYELESKYQDIFDMDLLNENSKEIVFGINYIDADSKDSYNREGLGEGSIKSTYVGPRFFVKDDGSIGECGAYGYGFDMPTQDLVDEFNPADPRLDMMYKPGDSIYFDAVTAGSPKFYKIYYPSFTTGYYCKKAGLNYNKFAAANKQCSGKNIPVIRYAEVLLNAAEAGYQAGHTGEALGYINDLRERARNSKRTMTAFNTYTYTPGTIPADLPAITSIDDIRSERRCELYLEGNRYFDVVRWGLDEAIFGAISQDVAGNPVSYKSATLGRFPIPQEQIILHVGGNLIQNPGY